MNKYKNIAFFEGLNGLRFFAAFLVLMNHAETFRSKNGLVNIAWLGLFRDGGNAVTFFFVLSGFLITYLLLKENSKTGTVSISKFYLKRVLRIWPLYFLLVIIGTLILPQVFVLLKINYQMPYTFGQVWYYFVFFMPGLVTFFFGHHFLEPLWSIGVEEVFYLFWAPLFKACKKNILPILLLIIAFKIILMVMGYFFIKNELFNYIVNTFRFEAMAIGGLGAYYIYHRASPVSNGFLYRKYMQVAIYLLLISYLIFYTNVDNVWWNAVFSAPVFSTLFIDFLFMYLIIGVSLADNSIIKLRNKFLSYLGEISYGIYMYHLLIITSVLQFLKKYLVHLTLMISSLIFYALVTVLVILIASCSKTSFESYFLNLKTKFDKPAEK